MKKVLSLILLCATLATFLVGCGGCISTIGVGYHSVVSATDAEGEKNGKGNVVYTVAAVILDVFGRVAECRIDVADIKMEYTSSGEALPKSEFLTKRQMGDAYDMFNDGLMWYEQATVFERLAVGKNIDGIRSMVAEGGGGNGRVVNAGCTITVSDFALAVEDAIKNATTPVAYDSGLGLAISTSVEKLVSANGDKNGEIKLLTDVKAVFYTGEETSAYFGGSFTCGFAFDKNGGAKTDVPGAVTKKGFTVVTVGI